MWADSLVEAGRHVSWVLIEELAEGGDVLARLSRESPEFLYMARQISADESLPNVNLYTNRGD
jgi:hypothetical protein